MVPPLKPSVDSRCVRMFFRESDQDDGTVYRPCSPWLPFTNDYALTTVIVPVMHLEGDTRSEILIFMHENSFQRPQIHFDQYFLHHFQISGGLFHYFFNVAPCTYLLHIRYTAIHNYLKHNGKIYIIIHNCYPTT